MPYGGFKGMRVTQKSHGTQVDMGHGVTSIGYSHDVNELCLKQFYDAHNHLPFLSHSTLLHKSTIQQFGGQF